MRILLVEDTEDLAVIIQRELQSAGFEVDCATDGLRALELHASTHPDLIVLDWLLPKLDGLSVLRQIREHAATPVIMLTARHEELDRVIGLEAGADDYLTKPFGMMELIARIKAIFRRLELFEQMLRRDQVGSDADILSYRGLELNLMAHQAKLDGIAIDLSRTEFNLLRLFLSNQGRVFSRAYLLETIWEVAYVGTDRAVDNTIMRLRKKLGSMGDSIETVWGLGYRLQAEATP